MSKELKLETLEDLLSINTDGQKALDNKAILTKVKQLIKGTKKVESKVEEAAQDFPYEAISVVGNKLVTLKFDLESKVGRVVNIEVDSRDARGRNFMAQDSAIQFIDNLARKQKEIINE